MGYISQMIEFCRSERFTGLGVFKSRRFAGLGIFNSGRFGELGVW